MLKWQLIETENTIPSSIKWIPIDLNDYPEFDRNKKNKINTNLYEIDDFPTKSTNLYGKLSK